MPLHSSAPGIKWEYRNYYNGIILVNKFCFNFSGFHIPRYKPATKLSHACYRNINFSLSNDKIFRDCSPVKQLRVNKL